MKVIVFGAAAIGKNTLCTIQINESLKRRIPLRILETYVTQTEIGLPTSMAIGIPRRQILTLSDLQPRRSIFVGDTKYRGIPYSIEIGNMRVTTDGTE